MCQVRAHSDETSAWEESDAAEEGAGGESAAATTKQAKEARVDAAKAAPVAATRKRPGQGRSARSEDANAPSTKRATR